MNKNELFEHIQNFVSNMKDKRPGISNIYVFETTDSDGNVTDVKYGMNLMTNSGFNAIYKSGSTFALSDSVKLYVGEGVSNFDKSTSYMETPLFGGLAATNSNTNKDYAYPIMYFRGTEPNTGIITLISRFGIVTYPTNISNYDTDTMISEYGIGTGYNALWTHSHIYDATGSKSHITKKTNETMTIYIYMCLSMYEHVIIDNWANDIYTTITTNAIMFQKMFESNLYTYKRNNVLYDRSEGRQRTYNDVLTPEDIQAGIDSIIRNTTVVPGFTIWSQKGHDHGYIDGFVSKAPGCIIISPEYLPQAEDVSVSNYSSEDPFKPTGFSDKFGRSINDDTYDKNKWPTFTTLSDANVYTYNYHSNDWDNPHPFNNNSNAHYTNAGMETNYCLPIYYWANGAIQTAYVFQNTQPSNAILAINQGHATMIACDKYWDQSTWINITDFNNIPVEAQHCHYWITGSNANNIVPTREIPSFELLDSVGGTNGYQSFPDSVYALSHTGLRAHAESPTTHCLSIGGKICAINRQRSYTFATNDFTSQHFTYGKWLIAFRSVNNSVNAIDMSGLNDVEADTSVLSVTRNIEFSTNVNMFSQSYKTENGSGLICIQSLTSTKEAVILDISGNTITSSLHQWYMSCCLYGTNLIAYIPATPDGYIHIYNTTYDADVGTNIELPSGFNISAMFGNGNHLWFYNGTETYHVDVSTSGRIIESCNNINIASYANAYKIALSCVNDVTMIYDQCTTVTTMTNICFIKHTDPTTITNMSAFANDPSMTGNMGSASCKLKYINSHTLIANIQIGTTGAVSPETARSTALYICDLGRYINTGTVSRYYRLMDNFCGGYLYDNFLFWNGRNMFPVMNTQPIKITGKTKTITSFNHTKRVTGKSFELGFTNMPLWGYEVNGSGKPPGSPSPQLNGNGQIVGWS